MTHPKVRKMLLDQREGVGNPNRIAACMIMGDNYDHGMVCKTMASIKRAGVNKVFIAYNGRSRSTLTWLFRHLKKIQMPFLIQKFKWEDDFALARNQSFGLVPKDDFDWLLWIDADDELICEKPLPELLESLDNYTQAVYLRYDYAVDPETGSVKVQQWRERIMSTRIDWVWKYSIHEVCSGPPGIQAAKRDGVYVKHLRNPEEGHAARERNRRIISKALREHPDDPRLQFYFATEVMAEADNLPDGTVEKMRTVDAAITAYRKYLNNERATFDDSYLATSRIGDLFLQKNDPKSAINAYFDSIRIYPDWPDAYIGLSRACMIQEDWPRMKSFADIAMKLEQPKTHSGVTPTTYVYTPHLLKGIAEEELGEYQDALDDYISAREAWNPPNGMLDDKIENVKPKLAAQIKDKDLRKNLRGKRSEKSIAFVTAPLPEPWHPETEKTSGAGGAEICVMKMAERFAADGWRVAVFGTPAEYRGVDKNGVEWWNSQEYLSDEPFKVVVGSRIPELFESDINAEQKYLWMHDVNVGPRMYPFIDRPDRIIGLTNWHVRHLERLYGIVPSRLRVIPNGVDLKHFDWNLRIGDTPDLRFVWSSSPDRGLETLIGMWPVIRKRYPTARLDIFYGWNIIDKLIKRSDRRAGYLLNLKQNLLGNIELIGGEEVGIFQHGRVSQSELSRWQLSAHLWAYPTSFMETFCNTAIEMQAAGVIPIASNLAALTETVANKNLLVEGWPLNTSYQNTFLGKIDEVLESDDIQIDLQYEGREHAEKFTWDASYSAWNDLIREGK